ncbi:hypothetical protein HHI36_005698 [Cryptolaemus montrouzieri]|uniref:Uncharacterized protein n=1 Tax=Cryptolaemus montrouzieri TaxID=559131 RepID=A0ABD2NUV5_9CUCU
MKSIRQENFSFITNCTDRGKAIWQVINETIKRKNTQNEQLLKAAELNKYFANVGSAAIAASLDHAKDIMKKIFTLSPTSMFRGTTPSEIVDVVSGLQYKTSCDIGYKILNKDSNRQELVMKSDRSLRNAQDWFEAKAL